MAERIANWLLILLPAMLLGVLLLRPIYDVDIFWQLKLGEMALDRGSLVSAEPFAASHLGEPLAQLSWLGQIVMAAIRRAGGWHLLQLADALIWLGGFFAVAHASRLKGIAPSGILAAVMLAFGAAMPNASLRPQSFAVLCFGLLVALLDARWRWQVRLLCGVILLVLWQNLHPSVLVAAAYLGSRAAWAWLRWLSGRRSAAPWLETALTLAVAAAFFATPLGFDLIAVTARNAAASTQMQVNEWFPIWGSPNVDNRALRIAVPFLFVLVVWIQRRRIEWETLVPSLVLLVASMLVVRFSLFWAISIIPVLAAMLGPNEPGAALARREGLLSCGAAAVAVMLALIFHQPRFADWLPLQGIAALKANGVHGTVYADLPSGGPVIDGGYPDMKVALDGRYYVYSDAELALALAAGQSPTALAEIERRWSPAAILIDPRVNPALLDQIRRMPATWREIYSDRASIAFVRIVAEPPVQTAR